MIDENADLRKKLTSLGLTEKEAATYLALLPRGQVGTSKLIAATGLHGQFIYSALARLEELGLAQHAIVRGRRKYSAAPPLRLLSLVEEKKLAAQTLARQLQARYQGAHEQDFEVFQGNSAFIAHEFETLKAVPPGSAIDVIGGSGDRYFQILDVEADAYEDLRMKQSISVRYIGAPEQRATLEALSKYRKIFEYRIFDGLSTGMVNTNTYPGFVTLNIFGDPILSFTITNRAVAEGYREFFESLWKLSTS